MFLAPTGAGVYHRSTGFVNQFWIFQVRYTVSGDKIVSVFRKAIEENDPDKRRTLLARLSVEERSEVEGLLRADSMASNRGLFDSIQPDKNVTSFEQIRDYRIVELIGEGGMGQVYRAEHSRLRCEVALKLLHEVGHQRKPEVIARFEREIAAVGRLRHPNIVQATDAGVEGGVHYLVLELVEGVDARKVRKSNETITVADACEVIYQTAIGLEYAHEKELIHRDIKPSNLLISSDGVVKIADMGLAVFQDWDGENTVSGQIMGTLDFIAPEQINDSKSVDRRADIYSLGCTFYELLTGKAPFSGDGYQSTVKKLKGHIEDTPTPANEIRPDVPRHVSKVIDKMLAKNPNDRFQTVRQVAKEIAAWAKGSQLSELVAITSGKATALRDTNQIDTCRQVTQYEPAGGSSVNTFRRLQSILSEDSATSDLGQISAKAKTASKLKYILLGLLVATGFAIALNANQIMRVVTNKGVLVIENGEGMEVKVVQGEQNSVVVFDKENQKEYQLAVADDYRLLIRDPETGIEFRSETFSISRNSKKVLDARAESLSESEISSGSLNKLTQGELINWMLDHGAMRLRGYDQNLAYFIGEGKERLPSTVTNVTQLNLYIDTKLANQSQVDKLLAVSKLLPVKVLFWFGSAPTESTLREISKQKSIVNVRFYNDFDFEALKKLPARSFGHVDVLVIHSHLPTAQVKLLVNHFPNLDSLNIERFNLRDIEALVPLSLKTLVLQPSASEPLPRLDSFETLEEIRLVYNSRYRNEPEFELAHLPQGIKAVEIQNAAPSDENFEQLKKYKQLSTVEVIYSEGFIRTPRDISDSIARLKTTRPEIRFLVSKAGLGRVAHPVPKDTGMDWLANNSGDLRLLTPTRVRSATDRMPTPDLYPASNLINGSGLSRSLESVADLPETKHAPAVTGTSWVTDIYRTDYFNRKDPEIPKLSFTLGGPETIEGFVYWGYVFTEETDASSNEPKAFKFTFRDSDGNQIGDVFDTEVSAPIRLNARVIELPSVKGVCSIDVEISDNCHFPESNGNRVGMSEVRFLAAKPAE